MYLYFLYETVLFLRQFLFLFQKTVYIVFAIFLLTAVNGVLYVSGVLPIDIMAYVVQPARSLTPLMLQLVLITEGLTEIKEALAIKKTFAA